jgi:hypothetical protein
MMALDFQDGISHPAAKPQRLESSLMMALHFQDGISHPAAWPQPMESSLMMTLDFRRYHTAAKPWRAVL